MSQNQRITRLAPSPTGALHLGNAQTFLINWALARRNGWQVHLRIDDLDTPRTKPGAEAQAVEDLQWLGLDWNQGPVRQTDDLHPYFQALDQLQKKNLIYPCTCTRRDIQAAASAPHDDHHDLRYPGTCRSSGNPSAAEGAAWRVRVPDEPVDFEDQCLGAQSINVQEQVGDFVVKTKSNLPAYQLAVVVDDAAGGVSDVVRGADLLDSTPRQLWLYRWLGIRPEPRYWHVPLVVGTDGRRLAKRHGDTRIATLRNHGAAPEQVIGLLGGLLGLQDHREPMRLVDFVERLDMAALPRGPLRLDPAWVQAIEAG